ncbi:protein angel homolog 2-like [Artemia franciscana]|uniref:protein angel homolog 2-like n=1 Tax=Artemia franciscana TaxID=6661 RepID=UPI0032DBCB6B
MRKNGINILNRDNIALISILTPFKNPDKQICIVNTHLLYNRKREDVRLAQLQILLAEINRVACKNTNYFPVILRDDLNLTPSSKLYSFLSQGKLKYEHLDIIKLTIYSSKKIGKTFLPKELYISDSCQHLQELEQKNCIEEAIFSSGTLTHIFAFKSVYNSDKFPKARLNSTNHNLIDHILYSNIDEKFNKQETQELILLERLRLPTNKDCLEIDSLPNSQNGSGHYHLEAKFRWNCEKKNKRLC